MSHLTFIVYQDRAEQWRWRLVHENGNIIADSGQGYTSKRNAINGIETLKGHAPDASVEEHSIEELDDPPAE